MTTRAGRGREGRGGVKQRNRHMFTPPRRGRRPKKKRGAIYHGHGHAEHDRGDREKRDTSTSPVWTPTSRWGCALPGRRSRWCWHAARRRRLHGKPRSGVRCQDHHHHEHHHDHHRNRSAKGGGRKQGRRWQQQRAAKRRFQSDVMPCHVMPCHVMPYHDREERPGRVWETVGYLEAKRQIEHAAPGPSPTRKTKKLEAWSSTAAKQNMPRQQRRWSPPPPSLSPRVLSCLSLLPYPSFATSPAPSTPLTTTSASLCELVRHVYLYRGHLCSSLRSTSSASIITTTEAALVCRRCELDGTRCTLDPVPRGGEGWGRRDRDGDVWTGRAVSFP